MHIRNNALLVLSAILGISFFTFLSAQEGWTTWRGPANTGVSYEKDLISSWSQDGENLIWRVDFVGRSTPILFNGRVYVSGRSGTGKLMQERVACFNAENGDLIWEHYEVVRNTYAPFSRVGWASPTIDQETGNVYYVGAGGIFNVFSADGEILWSRSLIEDFGARTGYGGRITSPLIDKDRVIIGIVSAGWGSEKPMKHRHFAFDKRSGEQIWTATPGYPFKAPNIFTSPIITNYDSQKLLVGANADGNIYAMQANTGKKIWEFKLSKRGLNSSVTTNGLSVFAAHGEENVDESTMGRVVRIGVVGEGDITPSNEKWRAPIEVGWTSPLLHDGRVYFIDNAANLYALDADTGEEYWQFSLGTVGRGSPVWADGKIYVTEANGRFHILQPGEDNCVSP